MTRPNNFGVAVALALLLIASAVVVVTRAFGRPEASQQAADGDEDESPPTADEIARAGERLAANGFEVSDDVMTELATVRVGARSASSPGLRADPDRMADLRVCATVTARMEVGWAGARSRRSWDVHPGIGSIMGNGADHESPQGSARIADCGVEFVPGRTASEAARRRWTPDPAERERHETIVVRRLEPQTENVDGIEYYYLPAGDRPRRMARGWRRSAAGRRAGVSTHELRSRRCPTTKADGFRGGSRLRPESGQCAGDYSPPAPEKNPEWPFTSRRDGSR